MKLLVCATEYYPYGSGIANVAYNVVQQLEKWGVECTICSPTGPDIVIKPRFKSGRLALISFWNQVSKYFEHRQDQYDLAWLHYPLMLDSNPFKKSFVTIHSTAYGIQYPPYLRPYQLLSMALERHCLNKLNRQIPFSCVGAQIINDLRANGVERGRVIKVINGVDLDRFHQNYDKNAVRIKHGLPIKSKIFLSVGRLTHNKMPFRMINLFKRIQSYSEDYLLIVVGGGRLQQKLEEYSQKHDVRVIFLGHIENTKLPEIYNCADYFFMTSKYEGGEPTLTLAEAMASGLPCIVSRLPNLEFIEENNLGLLFDQSSDDVAESEIINYLRKDVYVSDTAEYARQYLDWEKISRSYFEEFCKAVNE